MHEAITKTDWYRELADEQARIERETPQLAEAAEKHRARHDQATAERSERAAEAIRAGDEPPPPLPDQTETLVHLARWRADLHDARRALRARTREMYAVHADEIEALCDTAWRDEVDKPVRAAMAKLEKDLRGVVRTATAIQAARRTTRTNAGTLRARPVGDVTTVLDLVQLVSVGVPLSQRQLAEPGEDDVIVDTSDEPAPRTVAGILAGRR
jgi:hypothetical protein